MKLSQTVLSLAAIGGAGVTPPQPLVSPTIVSYVVQQVAPGSLLLAPGSTSYTVQTVPTAELLISPKIYDPAVGTQNGEVWTCTPNAPNLPY